MNTIMIFHIVCALCGQIFAMLATCSACAFLYRHKKLKKKKLSYFNNFYVPLDTIEKRIIQSVLASFVLLSLSLVSGVFFAFSQDSDIEHLIYKILWAFSVWFWYLIVIFVKKFHKISRTVFAQMIIMGFFLILGSFFGTVFS